MHQFGIPYRAWDFHVIRNTELVFQHSYNEISWIVGVDLQKTLGEIDLPSTTHGFCGLVGVQGYQVEKDRHL
ncbi:hypothetical protein [Anaplasma bovis]|uniref:hypothetical protein n=1 Tax=Anaplasma bovis TaxID=186733 RepID=UPI002FF3EA17